MLTTVEARSATGDLLTLPLGDISGGFIVAGIEGLGPVKATIVTSDVATRDGTQLQATRRYSRNVIITLETAPDYSNETVRDLRWRLYDFFMPEARINLRFVHEDADAFTVEIDGVVEFFEWNLFTATPEAQISIICTDPDFVDLVDIEVEGGAMDSGSTEILLAYPGTVDTGFVFTMTLDREIDELDMYVRGPDNVTRLFTMGLGTEIGDILTINSIQGQKSVTLTRGGTPMHVLYGVQQPTQWPVLARGNNYIRVIVGESTGTDIPYEVVYTPKYGGL